MLRASKSSDGKPKGKMTAYAFFVQTCREDHKKRHPTENVVFTEFSKKCAEKWRSMSEKEKKKFQDMADKDKKRYDTEMKDYNPPDNGKAGKRGAGKRGKRVKDPNAPKRPLSAYFWFSSEERGKVKERNPDFNVADIAKELGRRWAGVDPSAKARYEDMASKDKARYDREMKEYKKHGSVAPPSKKAALQDDEDEDEDEEMDEEEESDG